MNEVDSDRLVLHAYRLVPARLSPYARLRRFRERQGGFADLGRIRVASVRLHVAEPRVRQTRYHTCLLSSKFDAPLDNSLRNGGPRADFYRTHRQSPLPGSVGNPSPRLCPADTASLSIASRTCSGRYGQPDTRAASWSNAATGCQGSLQRVVQQPPAGPPGSAFSIRGGWTKLELPSSRWRSRRAQSYSSTYDRITGHGVAVAHIRPPLTSSLGTR